MPQYFTGRNPFQGGMGFFTAPPLGREAGWVRPVAIPFRVGWGFSLVAYAYKSFGEFMSQSLSGWDGVFHPGSGHKKIGMAICRNPFQGGMGFFTEVPQLWLGVAFYCRNPFQGGMGFFTARRGAREKGPAQVAIPFRVGWGFSPASWAWRRPGNGPAGRNPFQGGMGFFTGAGFQPEPGSYIVSQSLSGWDGVFHFFIGKGLDGMLPGRNPFQGGMGFFTSALRRAASSLK